MNYPKAWLPLGNELMLQRVVRIVSSVVSPVIVVASQEQKLPELSDSVSVIFDRETGAGPLSAIAHGLDVLKNRCDAAYVTGCDTPLIREEFIKKIISRLTDHEMVMVQEQNWYHPLAAVYRTTLTEQINHLVDQERRRPIHLAEMVNTCFLDAELLREIDPDLRGLQNINTREQYLELIQEMGLEESTKLPF